MSVTCLDFSDRCVGAVGGELQGGGEGGGRGRRERKGFGDGMRVGIGMGTKLNFRGQGIERARSLVPLLVRLYFGPWKGARGGPVGNAEFPHLLRLKCGEIFISNFVGFFQWCSCFSIFEFVCFGSVGRGVECAWPKGRRRGN